MNDARTYVWFVPYAGLDSPRERYGDQARAYERCEEMKRQYARIGGVIRVIDSNGVPTSSLADSGGSGTLLLTTKEEK